MREAATEHDLPWEKWSRLNERIWLILNPEEGGLDEPEEIHARTYHHRHAILLWEPEKAPAREAKLVTCAIRDSQANEFDYAGRGAARAARSLGVGRSPRDRLPPGAHDTARRG